MSAEPIKVISEKCIGCSICEKVCPFGAITIQEKLACIDLTTCTVCGACEEKCPVDAIEVANVEAAHHDLSAYKDVWVFAEQMDGHIESITYELLGEGRKLADDLGMNLCAVLLGTGLENAAKDLVEHGADKVYVYDNPELDYFRDEPYAKILVDAVNKMKPNVFLCGATNVGRSLISRVAVAAKAGLTADCTGLSIDPETKNLLQTRPAFGGNIMATIETPHVRPQMATVRHKVMKEAELQEGRQGEVLVQEIDPELLKSRTKRLKYVPESENTVNISEAEIIVTGGRGIGKPENFSLLHDLAEVLGGGVGASRAAVDANWIPYSHQVGQTGKTVCPKIYIACGISGQIQHVAGMSSSDVIIAINKDPDAPIFDIATYGAVGDVFEILPRLTDEFRKLLGK